MHISLLRSGPMNQFSEVLLENLSILFTSLLDNVWIFQRELILLLKNWRLQSVSLFSILSHLYLFSDYYLSVCACFFFLQPNKLIRLSLSRLKDYFAFSCETNYLNLHNNANFATNDSRQRKYTGKLCSFSKLHLQKVLSQVLRWCLTEVA